MKFLVIASLCCLSLPLTAQETPYSPIKKDPGSLISLGTFSRSPVKLNDFTLVETKEVLVKNRLDFQQTYDVQFWDLVESMEKSYETRKPVSVLDEELVPNAKGGVLYIIGMGQTGKGATRLTLGDKNLPYKFVMDITPDDQSRAIVTVQSTVRSMIYGGSHPARAAFRPVGAKRVKFRWE